MDPVTLKKLIISAAALGLIFLISQLLKLYAKKTREKFAIRKSAFELGAKVFGINANKS